MSRIQVGDGVSGVVTFVSTATGLPVDPLNPRAEWMKPSGAKFQTLVTRLYKGHYRAGDAANPVFMDGSGPWKLRGRCSDPASLVTSKTIDFTVDADPFGAPASDLPAPTVLDILVVTGQSLAMGYPGGGVYGVSSRPGVYMLKGGIVGLGQTTPFSVIDSSALSLAVEQHTVINGFTSDETGWRACADVILSSSRYAGRALVIIDAAVQATALASRKKSTTIYTNMLSMVTAAKNLATGVGLTAGKVIGVVECGGETDAAAGTYRADLLQYSTDLNTDLKTITGQTEAIPVVLSQQMGIVGATTADSAADDCYLAYTYPTQFALAGAKFFLTAKNSPHMDPSSYRKQGALCGLALLAWADGGGRGSAAPLPNLQFISRSGPVITVDYDSPMAIDTSLVTPPASPDMYGFGVFNGSSKTISSVTVGDGPYGTATRVTITCAADPGANSFLRYALGLAGDPRVDGPPTTGPRGNLVATNRAWLDADGNSLPCYAPRFQVTVA